VEKTTKRALNLIKMIITPPVHFTKPQNEQLNKTHYQMYSE